MKELFGLDQQQGTEIKDIIGKYRENIKHVISSQFDDIIEEAQKDLEKSGEDVSDAMKDVQQLKKLMTQVLESKLDELEGEEPVGLGDGDIN